MIAEALAATTILYLATYYIINAVMLLAALDAVPRLRSASRLILGHMAEELSMLPGVSVLIPAHDEEIAIVKTVQSVLAARYTNFEVIVINDGSTDQTLRVLWDEFELRPAPRSPSHLLPTEPIRAVFRSKRFPNLTVVDKRNGGKADALNAGINCANEELICVIDADVSLEQDSLLALVLPFVEDPKTVATSGMIRLRNGCTTQRAEISEVRLPRSFLECFQVLEYIRSFSIGRLFFNESGSHLIISGACGVFKRQVLERIGGYQRYAVGEDMELVVRLHRQLSDQSEDYNIVFVPETICLTEAPQSLADLGRQRTRWHMGLLTALRAHRSMLFKRRYGQVGLLSFPYFTFFELLTPLLEALGWFMLPLFWLLGWTSPGPFLMLVAVSILFPFMVSLEALLIDRILFGFFRPIAYVALLTVALLEPFVYHQATVYFRLRAFWRFYTQYGFRTAWKSPARTKARAINDARP